MFIAQNVNYILQKDARSHYITPMRLVPMQPRVGRFTGYAASRTGMKSMLGLITDHRIIDEIPGDAR
jgi:hypothetical protein